jgi:Matrixin
MRLPSIALAVLLCSSLTSGRLTLNAQTPRTQTPAAPQSNQGISSRELLVVVVAPMLDISDATVAQWLDAASAVFQSRGGACGNKTPCAISLKLKGSVGFYPASGYIEDEADLIRIHEITKADVMIVKKISSSACQGELGTVLGCTGLDWMAITRPTNKVQPGILWAHEYGHFRGLKHRNEKCALMNRFYDPQNLLITDDDCTTIRGTAKLP